MNLQAQIGGQYSRQVSNQAGTSLPTIQQQPNMMQNSDVTHGSHNTESGSINARQFIQDKIYEVLLQRQTGEMPPKKNILDLIRRLEEGLYKTARTKEEYMNLGTLEARIHLLLRRTPNNQNQRYQQQNNANVAMGTMLPTPGVPQSGNSNLMVPSSTDNTLVGVNGGNNIMPSAGNAVNYSMNNTGISRGMHTGSYGSTDGLTDGSQQSLSNFFVSSGGNNLISSTAGQRMGSQMMPTPGFNNSNAYS